MDHATPLPLRPTRHGQAHGSPELAGLTGYKLFHNHLAVDLLLSVFEFGSPAFVRLREDIWLSVFVAALNPEEELPGLIFTFAPETTVRSEFLPNLLATFEKASADVLFIELTCPLPILRGRMGEESRKQHRKLASIETFDELYENGVFSTAHMPPPALTLNTSQMSPVEAASRIVRFFNLPNPRPNEPRSA